MSNDQEKLVISRRNEILGAWAAELLVSRPSKTVPLFVDQGSYTKWPGNGIQMKMH